MDAAELQLFARLVTAVERLADHFAPIEAPKPKRPAVLHTAIYDREERERENRRKAARGEEPQS